ncbi:MAG: HAMP domain-containing histidine kinase [Cyclobacteriaceae bacterium]|nr:HAMP domain-containing histidine kinase [Cyclobacteriaceae bacterium]
MIYSKHQEANRRLENIDNQHNMYVSKQLHDKKLDIQVKKMEVNSDYAMKIEQQLYEIKKKNEELEQSQKDVIALNNHLIELNSRLEEQVETRNQKITKTIANLKKTNMELESFVYHASHDLKGPISRIKGLSSLAKLMIPDSTDKEYLNLIESSANDMNKLLSKLTNVHELLNTQIVTQDIDVPALLISIKDSLEYINHNKDTDYTFNIKDKLTLNSDENLIRIIIENLVENALIFRKNNSKEVHHINIDMYEKDNMTNIIVRDNGLGIHPDYYESIFKIFFRASDYSKGTGLGLYLVKIAVDLLKGNIIVNSESGKFTEFTIQLPI